MVYYGKFDSLLSKEIKWYNFLDQINLNFNKIMDRDEFIFILEAINSMLIILKIKINLYSPFLARYLNIIILLFLLIKLVNKD
jgi:hypothetical protein